MVLFASHTVRRSSIALAVVAAAGLGLSAPTVASAGDRSVDPSTLTPAPPDYFNATCARTGSQIECDLAFTDPVSPVEEPTGVLCGTGAAQFEILDTWSRTVVGKRTYSGDGLLLRRHFRDEFVGTYTNSVTGVATDYTSRTSYLHDLAVPGDTGTGLESQTMRATLDTGHGAFVLEAGRIVLDHSDDAIVSASGRHASFDYFEGGDPSALQPICDALS